MNKQIEGGKHTDMRKKILLAAFDLFSEKGIDRVSVREIVEKAGVTKPVLYYYFKDKEDLCRQLFLAGTEEINKRLMEALKSRITLEDLLTEIFSNHLKFLRLKPNISRFALSAMSDPETGRFSPIILEMKRMRRDALKKILTEMENQKRIPPGRSTDVLHFVCAVLAHFMMNVRYNDPCHFDAGLPRRLARVICRGIR